MRSLKYYVNEERDNFYMHSIILGHGQMDQSPGPRSPRGGGVLILDSDSIRSWSEYFYLPNMISRYILLKRGGLYANSQQCKDCIIMLCLSSVSRPMPTTIGRQFLFSRNAAVGRLGLWKGLSVDCGDKGLKMFQVRPTFV